MKLNLAIWLFFCTAVSYATTRMQPRMMKTPVKNLLKNAVFKVQSGGAASPAAVVMITSLLERYSNLLQTSPYPTKIITSGILGGIGDTLIQSLERKTSKKPFDVRRLFVFMLVTAFYIAPVIHNWFDFLNKMPIPSGLSDPVKAAVMMLVDQTFGAVFVTIGFFYAFEFAQSIVPKPKIAQGESWKPFYDAAYDTCKNCLWKTLVANWYCWPILNYVNFLFVPSQYRVLFSNVASIFWNMFLSNVANTNNKE